MPRILLLTRYTRMGASSRLRTLQYVPYLQAAGFEVEVASFFDEAYLETLYSGRRNRLGSVKYFVGRISELLSSRRAEAIWLEKEALPWVPWPIERLMWPRNVPVVSDYDDAIFHYYDIHRSALVRRFLGRKIDGVMARSAIVFAGNDYLAERARAAGARRVELVPTVVDMQAYQHRPIPSKDGKPRIGWIGTPVTWAQYGQPMLPFLKDLLARHDAVFRAVGAGKPPDPLVNFEFPDWSEAHEVELIQGMDIGIMPLEDSPFARGKCGYKLIQYMACGLPVVASPVGVNSKLVTHGENGFLASTEAEWRAAIERLLSDPELRRRMGAAGRAKVESDYSIQTYGPKVAGMFASL